jgi:hemerythrin-like domain-containing protein
MPVQIGTVTHPFSDPTGLLSDCHRRIENFLGVLKSVADNCDRELTDEAHASLGNALQYFREAAPKHTADEEESLFPRLRALADAELAAALGRLDDLEKDHRWAEVQHATVERLGHKYWENRRLSPDDAQIFRNAVHQLQNMYRRHIDVEDLEIFPAAARVLCPELKSEIAQEMAARRSLQSTTAR